jgi:hypothetical protein
MVHTSDSAKGLRSFDAWSKSCLTALRQATAVPAKRFFIAAPRKQRNNKHLGFDPEWKMKRLRISRLD